MCMLLLIMDILPIYTYKKLSIDFILTGKHIRHVQPHFQKYARGQISKSTIPEHHRSPLK